MLLVHPSQQVPLFSFLRTPFFFFFAHLSILVRTMGAEEYFSIPIFFIVFRETTEAAIIVSVLLSFLRQVITEDAILRRRLSRQVRLTMR